MRLRNRVAVARLRRRLSKAELSRRAHISRQTLAAIERDDGYLPVSAVMTAIAVALDDEQVFWWEKTSIGDEQPAEPTADVA